MHRFPFSQSRMGSRMAGAASLSIIPRHYAYPSVPGSRGELLAGRNMIHHHVVSVIVSRWWARFPSTIGASGRRSDPSCSSRFHGVEGSAGHRFIGFHGLPRSSSLPILLEVAQSRSRRVSSGCADAPADATAALRLAGEVAHQVDSEVASGSAGGIGIDSVISSFSVQEFTQQVTLSRSI